MGDGICTVNDCPGRVLARGWCRKHYTRWYETKSLELGVRKRGNHVKVRSVEERFWPKVNKTETCWLWTSSKTKLGYGMIGAGPGGGQLMAHRVSWELSVGPIPDGLVIDHLCMVPSCVNPEHLEPVTVAENTRRGYSPSVGAAFQKAKTHCPQGHPYVKENMYVYGNRRVCKTCIFDRTYARRAAAKAQS